jgi:ATP-binding cassette subfamily B protein
MIRLLVAYLRPYRLQVAIVLALLLVQALANLYLPSLNADIINNGVSKGNTNYIVSTGGFMLLVTLLLGVCSIAAVYVGARVAMGFGRDVRAAIFRRVQAFSQVEVNRFGTASLITRNTNDVQQVQMVLFIGLTVMVSAPILAVGGVIMAFREDAPLSALLIVILPLMALVIGLVMRKAIPLFQAMQVKLDRINLVTREALAGVRVIRAFVRTRHEEERFDEANKDLFDTSVRVNRLFALMIPVMTAIFNLSTVAVMWFGALRVDSLQMPIGNLTAFLAYLMQILFSVLMAVFLFILVPRGAVSAGRIIEVLDQEPSVRDPEVAVVVPPGRPTGTVEFRGVGFKYPGAEHDVLHDISFTTHAGETTAIVGSTGSGKSTLVNLIPRFYDVTEGTVFVDGEDVRDLARADLWSRMGVIPQKAFLFSGTVASNLRFGDENATDDELWAALDIAQGRDFVSQMAEGLDAPITQGGSNLSGGQRQRLAIARAIVKKAEIYIFDDSFSALDFRTDSLLRAALRKNLRDASVIIVAQRVGTIMNADRIVVMDQGNVVGIGTHTELMETCETYQEIVSSQLSPLEAQVA